MPLSFQLHRIDSVIFLAQVVLQIDNPFRNLPFLFLDGFEFDEFYLEVLLLAFGLNQPGAQIQDVSFKIRYDLPQTFVAFELLLGCFSLIPQMRYLLLQPSDFGIEADVLLMELCSASACFLDLPLHPLVLLPYARILELFVFEEHRHGLEVPLNGHNGIVAGIDLSLLLFDFFLKLIDQLLNYIRRLRRRTGCPSLSSAFPCPC